jgi:hypothetical protein
MIIRHVQRYDYSNRIGIPMQLLSHFGSCSAAIKHCADSEQRMQCCQALQLQHSSHKQAGNAVQHSTSDFMLLSTAGSTTRLLNTSGFIQSKHQQQYGKHPVVLSQPVMSTSSAIG